MLTRNQKIKYLIDSALASGQKYQCTYCKSEDCKEIDRKYLVTKLMECQNCHLYFRYPVDKKEENANFYQTEYQESDELTTHLPDALLLEKIKIDRFTYGNKNADRFLDLFARLFPEEKSLRIIDYGSSWGYTSYQFKQAGHQVQGYEISKPRATYGIKNLEVDICLDEKMLRKENHIFFSYHVIEHHPDIASMINLAKSLLKDGGYFIAFSPNGSLPFRHKNKEIFHRFWGKVHPNFMNADFYKYIFQDQPYYITSNPVIYENIHPLQMQQSVIDDLSGVELLVIAKFVKS
jgi:2-polyprenyl-3-methyl-5-hydroxy-6-metoxy-1,4-benzoquinol methylase